MTTMETPYVMASRTPFFLSLERLRKKLTVIGMIGHTQGVNKATSPPTNPMKNMYIQECPSLPCPPLKAWSSLITGVQSPAVSTAAEAATMAVSACAVSATATVSAAGFSSTAGSLGASAGPSPLKSNSTWAGGMHISSLHEPYSRYPLTW